MPLKRHSLAAGALALALAALACETLMTDPWDEGDGPPVALTLQAALGDAGMITLIAVEVTGPGIPVPIVANLEVEDDVAEGTITVPAGNDRVFSAFAFDVEGETTHEGSTTVDVRPGMSPVRIPLVPRGVGVPIEAVVSAFQVGIDPISAAVDAGQTVQFTATVADGNGVPVAFDPEDLTWASSNPAVVQVDGAGLATALYPGTATVAVSYQGVAAAATLVVTGDAPLIAVTPGGDVEFAAEAGGADPDPAVLEITNGGGGTLDGLAVGVSYGPSQPTGWLVAELSGTAAPATLTLAASTGELGPGTYTASVAISAPGAANSPRAVPVTFSVGEVANAIYVSTADPAAADDAGCGLGPTAGGQYPCRTIAQGLARAAATGRTQVLVANGLYPEAVTLVSGMDLLGGFVPDTWQRDLAATNTIIEGVSSSGSHDRTVIASGIGTPTVFEGFVVRGALNAKPAGNSYAIYVSSASSALVIRHNVVQAGRGGPGASGQHGNSGAPGTDGAGRDADPELYDARIATGTGACNPVNDRSLTNGGGSVHGDDDVSGGHGGGNRCPPADDLTRFSALDGVIGQSAVVPGGEGGPGGPGGFDARLESNGATCVLPGSPLTGTDGLPGSPGAHGGAVPGGTGGSVQGGHWLAASGFAGLAGRNGGGAGGGGAGGGAYCLSCAEGKDRLGGHGGGGGAGGEGGSGGGPGSGGGGTFGIFVVGGSAPSIHDNVIVRGEGGTGGIGGNGGAPGLGGAGGTGGQAIFCTGAGGRGGDGGIGGYGSGGGGGAGGGSFGIYTSGVGSPGYCSAAANNTIGGGTAGPGGGGGGSLIHPGGTGTAGPVVACSFN